MNSRLDEPQRIHQRLRLDLVQPLKFNLRLHILSQLALFGGVLLILAIAVTIATPQPSTQRYTLGMAGDERIAERFWQREFNGVEHYRWTNGSSYLNLNEFRGIPLVTLSVRLASPKSAPDAPRDLTLWNVGRPRVRVQVGQSWRVYHILAHPAQLPWQASGVWLFSPTERAAPDDNRAVGVIVSDVTIKPLGERSAPVMWQTLFGLAALTLIYCWSLQLLRPLYAALVSLALGLLLIAIWLTRPAAIEPHIASIWRAGLAGALVLAGVWFVQAAVERRKRNEQRERSALRHAQGALLLLLSVFLGLFALLSLQWRMTQDSPLLFYFAYAIDELGTVPYRDLFEQNLPLTYALYLLVGKLSGYSDTGFRLADLLYLAAIAAATWAFMRRFCGRAAWMGAVLFPVLYLGHGAVAGMQREYLMILPLALALLAASSSLPRRRKSLLAGLSFGLSVAIKPQALIAFPPIALFLMLDSAQTSGGPSDSAGGALRERLRSTAPVGALALGGALLPLAISLIYLGAAGGLEAFLDMWRGYLPLFAQLSGTNRLVEGPARTAELVQGRVVLDDPLVGRLAAHENLHWLTCFQNS